ncbi:hypothetical protein [Mycobacterium sp. IDR2000157661]|uniref:hypothetical protein n=1 Tax=Mycobacterium sp. IDR2000157661 TaxID=2867005 RepID=UPI001EEB571B|nr:hypothetical protein [Mycobacterium sp. IDR2000157661]ULE33381.1 hypothetical protein K3G64_01245 [Mycobacterium sp. IDR2000157661]
MTGKLFDFRFATAYRIAALPFGIAPSTCEVLCADGRLSVRFGLWRLRTTLDNVADVSITGPYAYLKTAGPAHLSVSDRGLTFATNGERGVCIEFRTPVGGIEPTGRLRHPSLTVTVADCDGLARVLRQGA